MAIELDQHDHRILAELQADARLTMAELGRRVHLSQPAVTERVRKLEDSGVICGYRAVVDAGKLGYGIRSIIRIGNLDEGVLMRALESSPEVVTAYGVTGEDSWILEIAVRDVAHLRSTLSRFCQQVPTSTAIILNAVREHAPIKPLPTMDAAPVTPEPDKKNPAAAEPDLSREAAYLASSVLTALTSSARSWPEAWRNRRLATMVS